MTAITSLGDAMDFARIKELFLMLVTLAVLYVAVPELLRLGTGVAGTLPLAADKVVFGTAGLAVLAFVGWLTWNKRQSARPEDRARLAVRRRALPPAPAVRPDREHQPLMNANDALDVGQRNDP